MDNAHPSTSTRRPRVPPWLFQGLDLIDQRRRALLITFSVVVVIAAAVAVAWPSVLPPTPLVGGAIGVAGLLLALALLIALDTADLKVRGVRHVRAAGGELVAVLPSKPSMTAAAELASAIEEVRPHDRTLLLGMAAATGDGKRVARWASAVARSLAEGGTSVLSLDLTADDQSEPGFLEVVREGASLAAVTELDPDLRQATLGPGRDAAEALRAFNEAGRWIPRDLEVLLVALPMAASRGVVRASLSLDQLLIVAERDRTSRVELIAGLDATEAVGTHSQVILIDDAHARYLGVGDEAAALEAAVADEGEDDAGVDDEPPQRAPTLGEAAESASGFDGVSGTAPAHDEAEGTEAEVQRPDAAERDEPSPPGASDVASRAGSDDEDPRVGARDVDVVMGAAAASALANVEAYGTSQEGSDETGPDEPGSDELTARITPPTPVEEDETTLEVEPRPSEPSDRLPEDAAEPDRAEPQPQPRPEAESAEPEPERLDPEAGPDGPEHVGDGSADADVEGSQRDGVEPDDADTAVPEPDANAAGDDRTEEDLLNTTARLSLLMDEVADRDPDERDA